MKLTTSTLIYRSHEDHDFEIELECDVEFNPGYVAPYCQNPSRAAYGDPGEPASLDFISAKILSCSDMDTELGDTPIEWLKKGDVLPSELNPTEEELNKLCEEAQENYEPISIEYEHPEDDYDRPEPQGFSPH